MTAQIIFILGLLAGLAAGAVLWCGHRALADRARDGECYSDATVCALATNAVGPAVDRYNAEHLDRTPVFLPLSLRHRIGRDVAVALVAARRTSATVGPIAAWTANAADSVERIRRGIDFDAFPPGTVLDGARGTARAARLGDDGEWEVQYGGIPFCPEDVRWLFIEGELVLRGGGGTEVPR